MITLKNCKKENTITGYFPSHQDGWQQKGDSRKLRKFWKKLQSGIEKRFILKTFKVWKILKVNTEMKSYPKKRKIQAAF